MFQRKFFIENKNKHILCSRFFFEIPNFYEIMWKNIVELSRLQKKMWGMPIARWIPKATNTHSQYAIFIAFPLQQRLHERSSMLRYTYIGCPVIFKVGRLWDVIIVLLGMDVCNHIQLIAVCCTDAFSRMGVVLCGGGSCFCVSRLSSSTVCHLLMTESVPFFSIPSHFKTFTHFTLTKFLKWRDFTITLTLYSHPHTFCFTPMAVLLFACLYSRVVDFRT
jgi:hypothetical protein